MITWLVKANREKITKSERFDMKHLEENEKLRRRLASEGRIEEALLNYFKFKDQSLLVDIAVHLGTTQENLEPTVLSMAKRGLVTAKKVDLTLDANTPIIKEMEA